MRPGFDQADWQHAFATFPDPSPDDERLLEAALWVGREAKAHYEAYDNRFEGLGAAEATILAVATINRQFQVANVNAGAERVRAANEGAMGFDHLSNIRFENDFGQRMSSADFIEPAVDALESWLYDAARLGDDPSGPGLHDRSLAVDDLMIFYSLRRALKGLFDKALHLGLHLSGIPRNQWVPLDRDFAALNQAWQARSESNFVSGPMHLSVAWKTMSPAQRRKRGLRRSVTGIRRPSGAAELIVGELSYLSRRPSFRAMDRLGLEESYVKTFLNRPMPRHPSLTPAMVVDAWWVIADAAQALWAAFPFSSTLYADEARLTACAVPREALEHALVDALEVEPAVASEVVDFLSFTERSKGKQRRSKSRKTGANAERNEVDRGLWSSPLVLVPGEATILLPRAVFEIGSSLYRVEAWLEKGGIDDTELEHRGDMFEAAYCNRLADAVATNQNLPDARVARGGIVASDEFPEQVDFVACVGSILLVGEIKFLLTPADPHQWPRYFAKLTDAASQANRKAAALIERPDVIAATLEISEARAGSLRPVSLVILNHGAGFSLEVGGCRIVDSEFLWVYLKASQMTTAGVRGTRGRIAERVALLYANESEAAARFDQMMARPPVLETFLGRIEWSLIPYPRPTGGRFWVDSPFRGDLTLIERAEGADLIDAVR